MYLIFRLAAAQWAVSLGGTRTLRLTRTRRL